jgi:hypothetical protein
MSPLIDLIGSAKGYGWGALLASSSYESIATQTVGASPVSSITFSSIPSTYTHLQIRAAIFSNGNQSDVRVQYNGDTASNYSQHGIYGNGATAISAGAGGTVFAHGGITGDTTRCGVSVIDILDYANTNKYKTNRTLGGVEQNGSGYVVFQSGSWRNTAAITSITILTNATNYTQYSHFALYGIKGA